MPDIKMLNSEIIKAIDMNSEYLGISGIVLMENAGREIAREAQKFNSIAIFSGAGNNGGDCLVAARHLSGAGKKVKVYALKGDRTPGCERNFEIIRGLDSIEIEFVGDSRDCERIKGELDEFDLIIDGLIGVGVRGELREPVKSIVEMINSSKAYKICADVPTPGIKSDLTLSFHLKKTEDAKVVSIGIPKEAELYCGPGDVYLALPKRMGQEHKGDFGRVLVVGGSRQFIGTPFLVARSALRAGCDLSIIACPSHVADRIPFDANLIINPLNSESHLKKSDVDSILEVDFDSLVVGNGLGTADETKYALKKLLRRVDKPVILDADALKIIGEAQLGDNMIITPHATEFRILFGECGDGLDQRREIVEEKARKTKATIVLKGPTDIISCGDKTRLNRTGNPAMTVGGTGDVLAGVVGTLAVKSGNFLAACAGSFLTGLAGDKAFEDLAYSLTATDVIEKIPDAIKTCREFG